MICNEMSCFMELEDIMLKYLLLENIKLDGASKNRQGAIKEAGDILIKNGYVSPEYTYKMYQREELVSSYIGNSIAMPHGVGATEYIKKSGVAFVRYKEPIRWGREHIQFVMAIAAKNDDTLYMANKISKISDISDIEYKLNKINTNKELIDLINGLK